jgi:hypothetical protein
MCRSMSLSASVSRGAGLSLLRLLLLHLRLSVFSVLAIDRRHRRAALYLLTRNNDIIKLGTCLDGSLSIIECHVVGFTFEMVLYAILMLSYNPTVVNPVRLVVAVRGCRLRRRIILSNLSEALEIVSISQMGFEQYIGTERG